MKNSYIVMLLCLLSISGISQANDSDTPIQEEETIIAEEELPTEEESTTISIQNSPRMLTVINQIYDERTGQLPTDFMEVYNGIQTGQYMFTTEKLSSALTPRWVIFYGQISGLITGKYLSL